MSKEIEEYINQEEIMRRALCVIEEIAACSGDSDNPIYRFAHAARAVDCRKNHPDWLPELMETYYRYEKE